MERERGSKVIAIIALCVGIVGLSLGFAAFSSTLRISSSAEVKPSGDTFNVDFSTTTGTVTDGQVTPTVVGATGEAATISNAADESTITGLKANFTEPGQTVTYKFYAHNEGEYEAFLTGISYANATEATSPKVCTPGTGTTKSLVDAACENISLTVNVTNGDSTVSTAESTTTVDHSLAAGATDTIEVVIAYTGTARADGDFTVAFGDVTLEYESVK